MKSMEFLFLISANIALTSSLISAFLVDPNNSKRGLISCSFPLSLVLVSAFFTNCSLSLSKSTFIWSITFFVGSHDNVINSAKIIF
jgi:hydrogenase-4 membrane subunit HyfE